MPIYKKTNYNNSLKSLGERVSGEELLNAEDLIDEIKSVGGEVDNNGYITLYHRTTEDVKEKILSSGKMTAKEDGIFFSTKKYGQAAGYGDSVIEMHIPAEKLILDDVFEDEAHLRYPLENRNTVLDISKYITFDNESHFQFSEMKITEIKDNTVSDLKQIRKNIAEAKEIKNGKELLDVMTEQARNWKPTFQEYKEMLDFRAKFYRYSMRNVSLIYLQNPNASYVGSFKHFKDLGYNINKGEHGMLIFAPRTLAMAEVNPGDWRSMKELTDEQRAALKNGSLTIKDKTYFVKGYVFDISQTDCPQEDLPKLLRGMSAKVEAEDYYTALKNITEDYGIGFSEENLKSVALKGYFAPSEERIVINERLSVTDKATVLTHELSHALLHANSTELSVSQIEFEAESTAYIALKQSGFDMSDYSFRYIQSYLKSLTPEELQKALTRIDNCGNLLCEKLKEQLEISRLPNIEHCQEIGITDN